MIKPNRNLNDERLIDHIIDRSRDKDSDGIDDEDERLIRGYEDPKYWDEKFFKRAVDWAEKTIKGSNKAGRAVGIALDVIGTVLPAGSKINKLREGVKSLIDTKEAINTNKLTNDMESFKDKIIRYIKQPSTQAALALIATVAGAVWSGVEIDVEQLTSSAVGIVTALAAVYAAAINIFQMFRDEDKPAE